MAASIFVVGLSHRTAPVEVRERLAVPAERLGERVSLLARAAALDECVLVSTCNRVEVYGAAADARRGAAASISSLDLASAPDRIRAVLYEHHDREAVHHAFRVAASLDSMVLGEAQILGQMKAAYTAAQAAGTVGALLGRCFDRAFATAKRVRTETGLAEGTVSVSSIACEVACKIFGHLGGRRILLVGAGKMSEAAARHLKRHGADVYVMNRSAERAAELARACGGESRRFEELGAEVALADIVIASTASPRFIVTPEMMHAAMRARRHRMMLLIDISVPRNVDPRAGMIDNVFLYDVDDLEKVSAENIRARKREAAAAERIVTVELETFEAWRLSLDMAPTIAALRKRFRDTISEEVARTLARVQGLGPDEQRRIDAMCDAMVNKLLHRPAVALRERGGAELAATVRDLFGLDDQVAREAPTGEAGTSAGVGDAREDRAE